MFGCRFEYKPNKNEMSMMKNPVMMMMGKLFDEAMDAMENNSIES